MRCGGPRQRSSRGRGRGDVTPSDLAGAALLRSETDIRIHLQSGRGIANICRTPNSWGWPMSHSYTNLLYHIVFATKNRQPWLHSDFRPDLYSNIEISVRDQGGIPMAVGGVEDHVHLLAKLRPDRAISDVISSIKSRSSGWIHREIPTLEQFAWQTGYGAFTLGPSATPGVTSYIRHQVERHCRETYEFEFRAMLRAAGFDEHDAEYWE